MILEEFVQSTVFLISLLFVGCIAVILLINLFLKIKQKFTDLFGHALKNSNDNVRKAYVMKLNDEEELKKVALNEYNQDIAVEAVGRINNKYILEEISKSDKFSVSRAALRKIREL